MDLSQGLQNYRLAYGFSFFVTYSSGFDCCFEQSRSDEQEQLPVPAAFLDYTVTLRIRINDRLAIIQQYKTFGSRLLKSLGSLFKLGVRLAMWHQNHQNYFTNLQVLYFRTDNH